MWLESIILFTFSLIYSIFHQAFWVCSKKRTDHARHLALYRPQKPQESQYYQCVEDHFERFEQVYDDRFAKQYGFLRSYVKRVIYRYLDCGILHNAP